MYLHLIKDERLLTAIKDVDLESFRWIDRKGGKHLVRDMDTHHLFFSLRMIWNHSVPEHLQLKPFIQYSLNRTVEYLKVAVLALACELITRNDLNPEWEADILHMISSLKARDSYITQQGNGHDTE